MYGGHYTAVANCERIIHPVIAREQEVASGGALPHPHAHTHPLAQLPQRMHRLSVAEYLSAPYVNVDSYDDVGGVREMMEAVEQDDNSCPPWPSSSSVGRQWVRFDDEFATALQNHLDSSPSSSSMHSTIVTGEYCTVRAAPTVRTNMSHVLFWHLLYHLQREPSCCSTRGSDSGLRIT